jgi:co-chaperonin GroES (HSP10)
MLNHQPRDSWILLKPLESPRMTGTAGLMVPEKAHDNLPYAYGRVESVGPGRVLKDGTRAKTGLKTGDIVTYAKSQVAALLPLDPDDFYAIDKTRVMVNADYILTVVQGYQEPSLVLSIDGKPLPRDPQSRGNVDLSDYVIKNKEDAEVSRFYNVPGMAEYVDEHPPGEAADEVSK